MDGHKLKSVKTENCRTLQRNPQYLTESQMESLKRSIERDGFVVPILVRPLAGTKDFDIVSGNHRFLAARELGYTELPAIIADLDDRAAKRLAINLNTVHGEPTVEQLAPFLAELDDELLREIHLEDTMMRELMAFDESLASMLHQDDLPRKLNARSDASVVEPCKCPSCGNRHRRANAPDDSE